MRYSTSKSQTHRSRQKVLAYINLRKRPASIQDVVDKVGITPKAASIQLSRLTTAGQIMRVSPGRFLPIDSGKPTKALGTAPARPTVEDLLTKLNELSRERSALDSNIAALETALRLLGYRPRKTRGPITDQQWDAIGRKAAP